MEPAGFLVAGALGVIRLDLIGLEASSVPWLAILRTCMHSEVSRTLGVTGLCPPWLRGPTGITEAAPSLASI